MSFQGRRAASKQFPCQFLTWWLRILAAERIIFHTLRRRTDTHYVVLEFLTSDLEGMRHLSYAFLVVFTILHFLQPYTSALFFFIRLPNRLFMNTSTKQRG